MRPEQRQKLRDELFPTARNEIFAPSVKATVGFCRPPRSIALVAGLCDLAERKLAPGRLYMSLWTHDFGEGLVEVDPVLQIYEADPTLSGSRAERYFKEKIGALTKLGLVETKARGHRDHGYVLLRDPHLVVQRRRGEWGESPWWDRWWAAYESRCRESGIELGLYTQRVLAEKAEETP